MNVRSARGHRPVESKGRGQRRRAAAVATLSALFLVLAGVVASSPASAATSWSPGGECGSVQQTTVPDNVFHITVDISGGNGGKGGVQSSGTPGPPGAGARVVVSYSVSPGDVISAIVGCNGAAGDPANDDRPTPSTAGWSRGGGTGQGQNTYIFPHGAGGGAGGGASAVCFGQNCTAGNGTPLVVAGGGGGSGSSNCAGTTGGKGGDGNGSGALSPINNGTGTSGGTGGPGAASGLTNWGIAGGAGGVNASGGSPNGGSSPDGSGGVGVNVVGGGGGGGYVGGGAGANAATGCVAGGAGGAGSSWYNIGYEGTPINNAQGSGGAVVVTFSDPAGPTTTTTPPSTIGPPSGWSPSGPCGTVSTTVVPANVHSISIDASGGLGGKGGGQSGGTTGSGGTGAHLVAVFPVTPGQTISAVVGCNGANGDSGNSDVPTPTSPGWSLGGGTGQGSNTAIFPHGAGGGAGGGSSAVCLGATCVSGSGTPLVVAGGGGGSGSSSCNGTTGGNGGDAGTGSATAAGGGSGASGIKGGPGAADGTQNGGIPGGTAGVNSAGGSASGGSAPDGSGGSGVNVVGGGGGGGYVGGGAGANIDTGCRAGGAGGGGSSWVKDTVTGTPTSGLGTGAQVVVTFAAPAFLGPSAPTIGTATAGDASATLSWTAPTSNGGSPILGYIVTPVIEGYPQTPQTFVSTATKQTVTGLLNGSIYSFTVAAYNAVGNGLSSAASNTVIVGAPGQPVFQSATTGDGRATVTWYPPSGNGAAITGYRITPYIGGVAQTAWMFFSSANSDLVTGLTNGSTYTFKIEAFNGVAFGPASPPTAPIVIGVPGAPAFQTAVATGSASAKISWYPANPNAAPIVSHTITPYIGTVAQTPQVFNTSANSDVVTGLTNGKTYTFKIFATNTYGNGLPSPATAAITIGLPGAPAFQTATPLNASAKVSWYPATPNGGPILSHTITPYIGTVAQTPQVFNTSANSDVVTGLTNGTSYTFKIVATNAFGSGPASPATAAVTIGIPGQPVLQSATPAGSGSAKVSWYPAAPNGGPIVSHTITPYIGTVAQTPQVFNTSANSDTLTGLTNGATYTFKIVATNAFGDSPASPATAAIVIGVPSQPVLQSATPGNGTAKVQWYPPAGNGGPITKYTITPYIGTVAQTPQVFNTSANSDVLTGLTNGTTYTFKIVATNTFGDSIASPATAAITVGAPLAPAAPVVVPGVAQATVTWVAPTNNGSAITGYVVTPFIGSTAQPSVPFNSTATSQVLTGLTTGTSYTFKVAAVNANGTSVLSAASLAALIL